MVVAFVLISCEFITTLNIILVLRRWHKSWTTTEPAHGPTRTYHLLLDTLPNLRREVPIRNCRILRSKENVDPNIRVSMYLLCGRTRIRSRLFKYFECLITLCDLLVIKIVSFSPIAFWSEIYYIMLLLWLLILVSERYKILNSSFMEQQLTAALRDVI